MFTGVLCQQPTCHTHSCRVVTAPRSSQTASCGWSGARAKPSLAPPAHSRVVQPAGQAAGNQVSELLVVHLAAGVAIHLEVLQGAGMGLQRRCDENKVVEAALVGQLKWPGRTAMLESSRAGVAARRPAGKAEHGRTCGSMFS